MLTARVTVSTVLAAALFAACSNNSDGNELDDLVGLELASMGGSSMLVGDEYGIVARGLTKSGKSVDLTSRVVWTYDVQGRVEVDGTMLEGLAAGTVEVQAAHGPTGLTATLDMEVFAADLDRIEIDPPAPSLATGTAVDLTATFIYQSGFVRDRTDVVTWSTDAPGVATVDTGRVTGLSNGTATITATDPDSAMFESVTVTVSNATMESLELFPAPVSMPLGATTQMVATAHFSDSSTQDVTDEVVWVSDDDSIADFDPGTAGRLESVSPGSTDVTATHPVSSVIGSASVTVRNARVESMEISPSNGSTPAGRSQQYTATATYSDGSSEDVSDEAEWSSSDPTIAVPSLILGEEGLILPLLIGSTTVTATHPDTGVSGSTALDVTPSVLDTIELLPVSPTLALGTVQQLTAVGTFSDGAIVELTDELTWSSSDDLVGSVSNAAGLEGLVTSLGLGAITVTALDPESGVTGTLDLTVTPAVLVNVDVTPSVATLSIGETLDAVATGTYSDGSTQDLTDSVTWSSTNPLVASVLNAAGSEGHVLAIALGKIMIQATDPGSGLVGSMTLQMTPAELATIVVTPAVTAIASGTDQSFVATGVFTDASVVDLTDDVTWRSSNAAVATVSNAAGNEGRATGVGVGVATITATDPASGIFGTAALTVTPATLVSISVSPAASIIATGTNMPFTATGTYSDLSVQDLTDSVTWSSSLTGVASISNAAGTEGLASGVGPGVTTITATDPGTMIAGAAILTVTSATLVSVSVTPTLPSIADGSTLQFTATGTYSDTSNQDITDLVTWSSTFTSVATISNAAGTEGEATAISTGITLITATHPGSGLFGTTTLTVTAAELVSIAVTPAAPSVALGTGISFTATGTYTDSSVQDLTTAVTWSSSDTGVATISNAGGSEGDALSAGTGVTTITATHAGSGLDGDTVLTVTAAELVSIDVTPAAPSIALGTGQAFTATGTYTDSSTQNLTDSVTWSSSAPAVATISNAVGTEGEADSVSVGTTTITATHTGTAIDGSTLLTVTPAALVSIAVTPATPSIALGFDQQFTATGTYSDSSVQDLTDSVTWSSSSTGVATISNAMGTEGLATSAGTGVTTITATDSGTAIFGTTLLTVTSATLTSIAVTPSAPSIGLGSGQAFTATGTYSDMSNQDLTDAVTWSSSNTGIATISNAGGSEGQAQSVAIGATTITATHAGSGLDDSTTLTVTAATLVSIDVTPATPSIALGTGQSFVATGNYSDSSTQNLTDSVTWSSSDTGVATISNAGGSEGDATSVSTGATTITATDPGTAISGDTTLTVTPAVLVSIAVTPASPSVALGVDPQFTAIGTYSDSSMVDITSSVTWSSSNTGVATVSNAGGSEGLADTVAQGSTTITATDPGTAITNDTTLTVTAADLVSISVTPALPIILTTQDQQFAATGTYTDGSMVDITTSVTWSSSNHSAATISNAPGNKGLASAHVAGITTITATDPGTAISGDALLTVL